MVSLKYGNKASLQIELHPGMLLKSNKIKQCMSAELSVGVRFIVH